ncbi:hypothetical protein [Terriglobus saanensis]|uniref:Uncharacterized protein n=1 Tax=Terriglobus saanensis (strain ATCC BAA-1853 / DSM 23119 / SP1PR4) TaxID=401053 RepID=E8UZL9_TERSS|nr:hypothetical protein [Terriglobus saanensis]ADV84362.1 hypothetical protein AciPR4_3609 [Terriglobus saanensis SP1PR4]
MTKLNLLPAASGLIIATLALAPAPAQAASGAATIESSRAAAKLQYAGALTFSPDGVLFVGDNISGAVFAYPMSEGAASTMAAALDIEGIDVRIAALLKTPKSSVHINGMAVHPTSHDVYLSVSFGAGSPALVKVSPAGVLSKVDLARAKPTSWVVPDAPTPDEHFRDRTGDLPLPTAAARDHLKAMTPMRSMTIVDMKVHNGELFLAGISNQEFSSTLRRVSYPFNGRSSSTAVRIYHVAHERYETRAPIRAMGFATIDGQDTLIAFLTCSPVVEIPIAELKDGAKVTGRTVADIGNGQPLSVVSVSFKGESSLFVTNVGHDPRMIPISGLQKAVAYLPENSPHGGVGDWRAEYPLGPVGKSLMFIGSSLFADKLDDNHLVSVTRDAPSGSLNLQAVLTFPLPVNNLGEVWAEQDFKGGGPGGK